jgi:hypothetical protein
MLISDENKFQAKIVHRIKSFAANLSDKPDSLNEIYNEMMREFDDALLRLILLKSFECYYMDKMDTCCMDKARFLAFCAEKELEDGRFS